jgi:Ca-activated chloride channel family protein
MKPAICLSIFLLLTTLTIAQLSPATSSHRFGIVERGSNRIVEMEFVNEGNRETRLLTSNFPREYDVVFSSKTISPGESLIIRVKLNPVRKGNVKDEVLLYFTDQLEPVRLRFEGKVNHVDPSSNTPCPKFNQEEDCCDDWQFEVELRDAQTLEVLPKSRFRIIQQGIVQRDVLTNKKGQYSEEVPISYYYLIGSEEGYFSADTAMYINRRNSQLTLYLEPKEVEEIVEEELLAVEEEQVQNQRPAEEETQNEETDDDWSITIDQNEQEEQPTTIENEETEIAESQEPTEDVEDVFEGELPLALYRTNNIVFLIDVSQSMAQGGKLEILKASMYRLIEALRPGDRVSIMSYAGETKVLLESCSGADKDKMIEVIKALSAGGMTAGAKGFRSAYAKLRTSWLAEGNNQVIVVSDGAFRKADNEIIKKTVRKEQRRGAITTLVAVKSTDYAEKTLRIIADEGKGSLVELEEYDRDTEALLNEIKKQSLRR